MAVQRWPFKDRIKKPTSTSASFAPILHPKMRTTASSFFILLFDFNLLPLIACVILDKPAINRRNQLYLYKAAFQCPMSTAKTPSSDFANQFEHRHQTAVAGDNLGHRSCWLREYLHRQCNKQFGCEAPTATRYTHFQLLKEDKKMQMEADCAYAK